MGAEIRIEQKASSESVSGADVALGSIALARVIAEVRSGESSPVTLAGSYNRTYNRHNR
ncbi:YhhA family cyclophane-containing RiPP [Mesorhizobium opportunistum]|uniref:Uncharacterized protein n=1 Tax=Mesorhizobium opportunistum (strain LMG 24607 / HAMBI 3007 / WSM2075) TaxID=536019 RepID=F7Y9X1_MESOW|nr:YhhA family cyclophane-containing RiPP [Mesorhizobium opportunistum]AEH89910.1 conserved hypothetical protein [Mesorhizobium opportunistum WSM2075]